MNPTWSSASRRRASRIRAAFGAWPCDARPPQVYAVGGCSLRDGAPPHEAFMETLATCEVYRPEGVWEPFASLRVPRSGARVVPLSGRYLAAVGGCDDVFGRSEVLSTVEVYDSCGAGGWDMLEPLLGVPRSTAPHGGLAGSLWRARAVERRVDQEGRMWHALGCRAGERSPASAWAAALLQQLSGHARAVSGSGLEGIHSAATGGGRAGARHARASRSGQIRLGQARPGQGRPGQVRSRQLPTCRLVLHEYSLIARLRCALLLGFRVLQQTRRHHHHHSSSSNNNYYTRYHDYFITSTCTFLLRSMWPVLQLLFFLFSYYCDYAFSCPCSCLYSSCAVKARRSHVRPGQAEPGQVRPSH